MRKIINYITRFLGGFIKRCFSKRENISNSILPSSNSEQLTPPVINQNEKKPKLENLLDCHTAILFPDPVGDVLDGVSLYDFQNGYDYYFFYREDNQNYTEILDGVYVMNADENGVNVENRLGLLKVIGVYDDLKAIICFNQFKIQIVQEVESKGPDGLYQLTCFYKFLYK